MSLLSNLALALLGLTTLACGWLGWQLLRQNGRLLLRLEELEQRFDEWESGEPDGNHQEESEIRNPKLQDNQSLVTSAPRSTAAEDGSAAASRFGNRSLAHSRIKRDGLKAGTPAPDFQLPRLDGKGDLALRELRGQRVLLVFSSPTCGPCHELAPELEQFHRQENAPLFPSPPIMNGSQSARGTDGAVPSRATIVMISKGEPKENRLKVEEHGLTFPIVLQQRWEISRRYAMFVTPVAYLIDEEGVIARDVAVGVESILTLLREVRTRVLERPAVHQLIGS